MMNTATEKETVEQYLARGGTITRVPPSMPADLVYLPEHEAVDLALGASYDTMQRSCVTRFDVSITTMSASHESSQYASMESEYAE